MDKLSNTKEQDKDNNDKDNNNEDNNDLHNNLLFNPTSLSIFKNEDCIKFLKSLRDKSVDLIFIDPPFALNEDSFDIKHYNRKKDKVIDGYVQAPKNISYEDFCYSFIKEFDRVLKDDGSVLFISGWNYEADVQYAFRRDNKWKLINHLIWNYNFGVYTKSKYVSSHYHILWYTKKQNKHPYFNKNAYANDSQKINNRSVVYNDIQDVIKINKEYKFDTIKNPNQLPLKLCEKLIKHHTKIGGVVLDCFAGSFAISKSALKLRRITYACDLNKKVYEANKNILANWSDFYNTYEDLIGFKQDEALANQGKKIDDNLRNEIKKFYHRCFGNKTQKIQQTAKHFKRGLWSIKRIIDKE